MSKLNIKVDGLLVLHSYLIFNALHNFLLTINLIVITIFTNLFSKKITRIGHWIRSPPRYIFRPTNH